MKLIRISILLLAVLAAAACRDARPVPTEDLELREGLIFERTAQAPFTGTAVKYLYGGQKTLEFEVLGGKLHGKRTAWHPGGRKKEESEWWIGELIGRRCWDDQGNPVDCDSR